MDDKFTSERLSGSPNNEKASECIVSSLYTSIVGKCGSLRTTGNKRIAGASLVFATQF